MNKLIKKSFKSIIYVSLAQLISFLLGIAKTLILPLVLGMVNFGYWQVYLLYVSYATVLTFGFNDGVYLRYGKYDYEKLPKGTLNSNLLIFFLAQIFITLFLIFVTQFEIDANKRVALLWACLNIPLAGITGFFIYLLQTTNQFKKYSMFIIIDKIILLSVIMFIYVNKIDEFMIIVIGDIIAKIITVLFLSVSFLDLLKQRLVITRRTVKVFLMNIKVGSKLLFANFSGMLILGYGRILVERSQSIEKYSVFALANSSMNLIMIFITAIGLVVYPTFTRIKSSKYAGYYLHLNDLVISLSQILLILYFPLNKIITSLLPNYTGIFEYLPVMFIIIFIQAITQIVINPYYKLLRCEKDMLKANVIGLLSTLLIVSVLYFIFQSILLLIAGTALGMLIRLHYSGNFFNRKMKLGKSPRFIFSLAILVIFCLIAYFFNPTCGFIIYLFISGLRIYLKRSDFRLYAKLLIGK
ncbi:MAG TPA: hypothetical protein ENN33_01010 [Ignavibacteria bacterium]|nr:hypothetical protein [Ignavibacteria bacterium]